MTSSEERGIFRRTNIIRSQLHCSGMVGNIAKWHDDRSDTMKVHLKRNISNVVTARLITQGSSVYDVDRMQERAYTYHNCQECAGGVSCKVAVVCVRACICVESASMHARCK